uniref:Zinc finger CCCH domain-containing protein 10 n=1 Tax=Tetraodon nigroviridis TaxID=99883 RepID=H3DAP1_TETNG
LGNGNSCGNSGGGGQGAGLALDGVCRDFIRNVCKRGKRCRFRHPDFNEVPDLGQKNEFIFCHDHQNKECMRSNCRFVHGSKEDEDYYKKTGELPLRLRGKVAARLGLSPMDLPHSRGEVPICRDFLKGECQRGNKCKFRHVEKGYEYDSSRVGVGGVVGQGVSGMVNAGTASQRRYDRSSIYDPLLESGLFDAGSLETSLDHTALQLKRRRLEGPFPPRPLEYRFLEEENSLLRKRVEELKKQVSNLIATNEVLLEQNAQFRSQAKVMTLSSTPAPTEQSLAPPVGAVSSYNHGIAQTHTTLSSAGLQPRPVTQQDLVAPTGAPAAPPTNAAPPTAPPPHLNPEITPLSAALAQTIAQGMAPPVSMAPVAVSVAPVAVSMTQPLPGITMSHATTPMVSYPIASQSMRITTLPH